MRKVDDETLRMLDTDRGERFVVDDAFPVPVAPAGWRWTYGANADWWYCEQNYDQYPIIYLTTPKDRTCYAILGAWYPDRDIDVAYFLDSHDELSELLIKWITSDRIGAEII